MVIPVRRSTNGKWAVDVGKVDAALSLWMAAIEAKAMKEREKLDRQAERAKTAGSGGATWEPDWRRIKAAAGMKMTFYRILGTDFEDGVLKRDLSWWVDEPALEQAHSKSTERSDESVDFVIGFSGRPSSVDPRRRHGNGNPKEIGVVSSGFLPAILAQHLFTNFVWNISRLLPKSCLRSGYTKTQKDVEIEGSDSFSPYDFSTTWHRPKMRHGPLSKIAQQMETAGLGTMTQILFCMIPALSFHDLLPNHAILNLIPKAGQGQGWEETAHCYNKLLESGIRAGKGEEERLCLFVVVDTMDFLYLACEPYSGSNLPPSELDVELRGLAEKLASPKFAGTVAKLAPIYNLQKRVVAFRSIFKRYKPTDDTNRSILDAFAQKDCELTPKSLAESLGFTEMHYDVNWRSRGDSRDVSAILKMEVGR